MSKLTVTLSIIILLLVGYIIYTNNKPVSDDSFKQQIDSLNNKIDSLEEDQLRLDSLIAVYQDSVSILDTKIDSTKQKITEIRAYYGNKIKNISKYTPTQLDSFFTNRYK